MATYNEVWEIELAIERELTPVMEGRIADEASEKIKQSVMTEVYAPYTPKFYSRRGSSGGLMDKGTYATSYDETSRELRIEVQTGWQHLYGGDFPSSDEADVVENNKIYGAPPRPFIKQADESISRTIQYFEQIVGDHLNKTV